MLTSTTQYARLLPCCKPLYLTYLWGYTVRDGEDMQQSTHIHRYSMKRNQERRQQI
jgi:hypothetical protein